MRRVGESMDQSRAKVTGTCILKGPSMARGSRKCVWLGGEGEE